MKNIIKYLKKDDNILYFRSEEYKNWIKKVKELIMRTHQKW